MLSSGARREPRGPGSEEPAAVSRSPPQTFSLHNSDPGPTVSLHSACTAPLSLTDANIYCEVIVTPLIIRRRRAPPVVISRLQLTSSGPTRTISGHWTGARRKQLDLSHFTWSIDVLSRSLTCGSCFPHFCDTTINFCFSWR